MYWANGNNDPVQPVPLLLGVTLLFGGPLLRGLTVKSQCDCCCIHGTDIVIHRYNLKKEFPVNNRDVSWKFDLRAGMVQNIKASWHFYVYLSTQIEIVPIFHNWQREFFPDNRDRRDCWHPWISPRPPPKDAQGTWRHHAICSSMEHARWLHFSAFNWVCRHTYHFIPAHAYMHAAITHCHLAVFNFPCPGACVLWRTELHS